MATKTMSNQNQVDREHMFSLSCSSFTHKNTYNEIEALLVLLRSQVSLQVYSRQITCKTTCQGERKVENVAYVITVLTQWSKSSDIRCSVRSTRSFKTTSTVPSHWWQ